MALGNILRERKKFAECADVYGKGDRDDRQAGEAELDDLLFPRHLQRARQAVGQGRGRPQEGARALSRPAARAQLSRLFVDRSGPQSRRGHAHDPARGRAAAGRRLHRRLARLGLLPPRQLRRGGEAARARGRAQAEDPTINDHLGDAYWKVGRVARGAVPVVACARSQARAGRSGEDRGRSSKIRAGGGRDRRRPAGRARRRSPATAA